MTLRISLAALFLALCALPSLAHADAAVSDLFARATPPNARNGAAYATIESMDGDRLIAVSSPAANAVQIHDTTVEDGVAKMREIDGGLEIPAGGVVTLQPGGKHFMMMGLTGPLTEGAEISFTLSFEKAGDITLNAPVRKVGGHGRASHGAAHGQ